MIHVWTLMVTNTTNFQQGPKSDKPTARGINPVERMLAPPDKYVQGCMRTLFAVLLLCLFKSFSASAAELSTEQHCQAVFSELRALQPMQAGRSYTVRVAGIEETGFKEQFLRRRTAQEISDSGLSCGCGDYALLFIERIEPRGFTARLVDGAEISSGSLENHFSGHAVVAIRSKKAAADTPWWLVDSTNLKILSQDWSPAAKSFQAFGGVFWIGYCGPLAEYPVHNAEELKAFYTKTLAGVPREFLGRTFCRLKFTIDPSLIAKDGEFLNPRLADFLRLQPRILAAYGIEPQREVSILLARGGDDFDTDLNYSQAAGWISHVGLRSGCSSGLLSYFERTIRGQEQHESK